MSKFRLGNKVLITTSEFKEGDKVKVTGKSKYKGRVGIINYVIKPNSQCDYFSYLVDFNGKLPWFAESELGMAKEQVLFT